MAHKDGVVTQPRHRADRFIDPVTDPRESEKSLGDERETLTEFLRCQRLTLQLKCEGLDAAQLASRAVEPSTMSLLGLVRHMAEVERGWFRRRFAGQDLPKRYQSDSEPDRDFDGAVRPGTTRSPSLSNSRARPISTSSDTTRPGTRSPCVN
jgi:hypothetical protein